MTCKMKEETSHSQKINVDPFNEELTSSERTGRPKRLSSMSWSRYLQRWWWSTSKKNGEVHCCSWRKSWFQCWRTRQIWTLEFQDYHIQLWSTRRVPAFENWFRKLRTTQIDMLFNKTYDRINHTGTLASSVAHAGTSCAKEEERIRNSSCVTMDLLSIPEYDHKKGRPHGHWCGKKLGDKGKLYGQQVEEEVQDTSKECMTDSYEMKHSVIEWLKMVETKMFVDNGMFLQMRIIHTIWLHKNITITRVIGGWLRNKQVPILCQWSTDLTLSKHRLFCSNWNKKKKELAELNNGHKVLLLLLHGGVGKVLGGLLIPMKVTTEMIQVLIEQGDLLYKYLEKVFRTWFSWIHFTLLHMDPLLTAVCC